MKDNVNVFDLFNRFKRCLENIQSNLEIQIYKYDSYVNERICVKYPHDDRPSMWYFDVDIETNLQLFFLGEAINNRDTLINAGIIGSGFISIFGMISNFGYANQTTKNLVQLIGIPSSLEELEIKFDLLGI